MGLMVKKRYRKIPKNPEKNKLLPRVKEITSVFIENNCNIGKTAKQFKVDRDTLDRLLATDEAKAEIKRRNEETAILSENMTRSMMTECFNQFMRAKKKMTQKESGYFLANLIGLNPKVQIAKIQAGVGQGDVNRGDRQLSTEEWDRHREAIKNAQTEVKV